VKFGSNFQPFVRKRDVKHNEDDDMTREPEMVKAYRDTWELGLHSYLTYMRDRLLIARELLTPSGSIFVQISDENLHHVREVMDEVFGAENFMGVISFSKTSALGGSFLDEVADYLLWYGKDKTQLKYHQLYLSKILGEEGASQYTWLMKGDRTYRALSEEELINPSIAINEGKVFAHGDLRSQTGSDTTIFPFEFGSKTIPAPTKGGWKTNKEGMENLIKARRLIMIGNSPRYVRYYDDFPIYPLTNRWTDTGISGFGDPKIYVVQTLNKVIARCLLMTTNPGDLVLDPTCGSGTTAYVAEQWGRRWITIDTSRVPLALARQRLLTATFPYYELREPDHGPAGGFVYKRKQNNKGEEVGGIVPHVTLKSIANNEPPSEEVLVDRPEPVNSITRVSGPFCLEATIPTPVDWEGDGHEDSGAIEPGQYGSFIDRMLEVLRRSPVLHLDGGKTIEFKSIRKPAKTLSLSAEAVVRNPSPPPSPPRGEGEDKGPDQRQAGSVGSPKKVDSVGPPEKVGSVGSPPLRGGDEGEGDNNKPVAILFGPENGAISEKLVYEAARESHAKNYSHLFVIGFAIQPGARNFIDNCEAAVGVPATYVQATPDLLMGDLLKNMRSSQIFSVCGLPEIAIRKAKAEKGEPEKYEVELIGLDVFDPITMDVDPRKGNDVPAWFLDANYNGLCFHVSQAFFPRTSAWDNLKRALKSTHEDSVWDHLAGTVSASFEAGEHGQIAVKVIDDRGNELLVVRSLSEGKT
jgi:adenine-specific DNA-methyltransferase